MASRSVAKAILFDAVGTLLEADPPVAIAYRDAARSLGIELETSEVKSRLAAAMRRDRTVGFTGTGAAAALQLPPTSEAIEHARWQRVVAEVFETSCELTEELFTKLWRHFADPASWRLAADARQVIETLVALPPETQSPDSRPVIGLASNFDARLLPLCQALAPLEKLAPIFISSQCGYPKPDPRFFRHVEQQLGCRSDEMVLVGDDFYCDAVGAASAGWQVIWLAGDQVENRSLLRQLPEDVQHRVTAIERLAEVPETLRRLGRIVSQRPALS